MFIVKRLLCVPLFLATLALLAPARADDDGRFIGRSIDLTDRTKLDSNYQIPAPRPAPLPPARPPVAIPVPAAPAMSAETRSGNVRLIKTMPGEAAFGQEFMYQLQVIANENVADVIVRDTVPEGAVYVRKIGRAHV